MFPSISVAEKLGYIRNRGYEFHECHHFLELMLKNNVIGTILFESLSNILSHIINSNPRKNDDSSKFEFFRIVRFFETQSAYFRTNCLSSSTEILVRKWLLFGFFASFCESLFLNSNPTMVTKLKLCHHCTVLENHT